MRQDAASEPKQHIFQFHLFSSAICQRKINDTDNLKNCWISSQIYSPIISQCFRAIDYPEGELIPVPSVLFSSSLFLWRSLRRSCWTSLLIRWSVFVGWCAVSGKKWPTVSPCGERGAEEKSIASAMLPRHPRTGGCFTSCARREEICSRTQERNVRSQAVFHWTFAGVATIIFQPNNQATSLTTFPLLFYR